MADRRMFSRKIVESDAFLDMPLSAQALYFHLCMEADDEGFIASSRKICRGIGASADDLKLLLAKRFLLCVDEVIVVKHWRINNTIRADRSKPTAFQDQLAKLALKDNLAYTDNQVTTICQPADNQVTTNIPHRIEENRIEQNRVEERRAEREPAPQEGGDVFVSFAKEDKQLFEALCSFAAMRAEIDKPLSDRDKNLLITRLQTFPEEDRVQILQRSTTYHWSNIYELPERDKTKKNNQPTGVNPSADYEEAVEAFLKSRG